jgi:hypothetical protein
MVVTPVPCSILPRAIILLVCVGLRKKKMAISSFPDAVVWIQSEPESDLRERDLNSKEIGISYDADVLQEAEKSLCVPYCK